MIVIDFCGNEIVPECIEFEEIGAQIKVLKPLSDLYPNYREGEYWSILDSEIKGQQIDYLQDFNLFLVDDKDLYNQDLEPCGELFQNKSSYLIVKTDSKFKLLLDCGYELILPNNLNCNLEVFFQSENLRIVYFKDNLKHKINLISFSDPREDFKLQAFEFDELYNFNSLSTKELFIGYDINAKKTTIISIYYEYQSFEEYIEIIQPGNYEIKTLYHLLDLNTEILNLFEGNVYRF